VCTRYGPPEVLALREMEAPAAGRGEVCIRIAATAVTSSDCIVRRGKVSPLLWLPMRAMVGFRAPRRPLGMVLAGEVASIGAGVTSFRQGDQVFGFDPFGFGCYAQVKCMPAAGLLALKPVRLSLDEAAAIPYGGMLALHFLRQGGIGPGQEVLVYGASGAVGTAAVQLACHFGARVTGVCSTANLEMVQRLGADTVIDYTKEDFLARGDSYDLILDAVPVAHRTRSIRGHDGLTSAGRYVSVTEGRPKVQVQDLVLLGELAEAGRLRPVIDRTFTLDQVVEAHRYVDTGRKKGNVVLRIPE
jgi:NADPH:quinone reductase-like Zn-dependent oxidoreductase